MKTELVEGLCGYKVFEKFGHDIYAGNPFYRGTEGSIQRLVLHSDSAFNLRASKKMFVVTDRNDIVARFALINDKLNPDFIQVAFFEATEGLKNLFELIVNEIKIHFPQCAQVIVGLNGHFNYSAGFLLNRFDEVPLFGLPYSKPYYPAYFKDLDCHKMVSFRFSMDTYHAWASGYKVSRPIDGLSVRFMDKKNIKQESAEYTLLNNLAFARHPYWTDRTNEEDLELFEPFRFLLDNENLIFAEVKGRPVGFYLWYPDFNQLVKGSRDINVIDVLRYRLGKKIDTFRFTEIGIIPEYQRSPVALELTRKSVSVLQEKGYKFCEGGFIFEENLASIAFVKGTLKRCEGREPVPYREYAIYTTTLR